jgi:hypothetical protein
MDEENQLAALLNGNQDINRDPVQDLVSQQQSLPPAQGTILGSGQSLGTGTQALPPVHPNAMTPEFAAQIMQQYGGQQQAQPAINPFDMSGINSAIEGIKQGKTGEIQNAADLSNNRALLGGQEVIDAQKRAEENQARFQQMHQTLFDLNKKTQENTDQLMNAKLDPDRYMNSRTTGQKIMMGFAVALASLGDAAAVYSRTGAPADHAKNVMGIIQNNIQRDLQSQMFDYNKLKDKASADNSLFARNMNLYHNDVMAANQSMVDAINIYQKKLNVLADQSGSAAAPSLMKTVNSGLDLQKAELTKNMQLMALKSMQTKPASPQIQTKIASMKTALSTVDDLIRTEQSFPAGYATAHIPGSDASVYDSKLNAIAPAVAGGVYGASRTIGPEHVKDVRKNNLPFSNMAQAKRLEKLQSSKEMILRSLNNLTNETKGGSAPTESMPGGESE